MAARGVRAAAGHAGGRVLGGGSPATLFTVALAQGLKEGGYVEGQSVRIEYRWAAGFYDRLPGMAADLVKLRVERHRHVRDSRGARC